MLSCPEATFRAGVLASPHGRMLSANQPREVALGLRELPLTRSGSVPQAA